MGMDYYKEMCKKFTLSRYILENEHDYEDTKIYCKRPSRDGLYVLQPR